MKRLHVILGMLLLLTGSLQAQRTEFYTEPNRAYKDGRELFVKEKFGAALKVFDDYVAAGKGDPHLLVNARYYAAISAYELFHPDAQSRLEQFTVDYPENVLTPKAWFYLGRHFYRLKKYQQALPAFEKADVYYLSGEEVSEYYFKTGYCYFNKQDNEKAAKQFYQILNIESKYQTAAQYYYGHVAYTQNNYQTAMDYFRKLDSSATFGPLVPYYITQMYFEQKKYNELVGYTVPVLEQGTSGNQPEITRLTAEAYYRKGDYKNAEKYFSKYAGMVPTLSRDDHYSIGYVAYRAQKYKEAIPHFETVTASDDSLAQNAYYHLADCFLSTKNKQAARNAFQSAARLNFNPTIQEASRFNYAKLSYELNFHSVAVNAFREFVKDYPNSIYADESNELLARLYLTTRNYKDALAALDNIKNKNLRTQEAFQKVAYYRGVEFFNDGDREKAIAMFEKAITTDIDPVIRAQAMYWKGEALYAQNKFDASVKQYRIYLFNPGSVNTSMYHLVNYNLGYAHFKQGNYSEAQSWFRKYLAKPEDTRADQFNDATMRAADCFYALRDFDNALDYYNRGIQNKSTSADYALFQKGMIQGLKGDLYAKSITMQSVLTSYPKSAYRMDATFEKGRAQLTLGNETAARELFQQLLKENPNGPYTRQSLLNIGLSYYNAKDDDNALTYFKQVITKFPGTPEATEALTTVKNIYVANGKPEEYFSYVKNIPNASVSAGAQDSITYEAAEQRYLKGNFEDASRDFDKYLAQFPNGIYKLNATFYKAECDFRNKDYDKALTGYTAITNEPRNLYTEKSLLKAAQINYSKKNYENAAQLFAKLEQGADMRDNILSAQLGLMRCYSLTGKDNEAITYAQKLLAAEKVPNEVTAEAHLIYGRSAMKTADYTAAKREFGSILKQPGAVAAESRYNLALVEYQMKNYKASQTKCFDVINQLPSYDYWIGKSFLLLADNYLALADTFQAKSTLQSLIDNYEKSPDDSEDLKAAAQERYQMITTREQEKLKKPEETDPETDLSKEIKN
jgi:TolA-binding protein